MSFGVYRARTSFLCQSQRLQSPSPNAVACALTSAKVYLRSELMARYRTLSSGKSRSFLSKIRPQRSVLGISISGNGDLVGMLSSTSRRVPMCRRINWRSTFVSALNGKFEPDRTVSGTRDSEATRTQFDPGDAAAFQPHIGAFCGEPRYSAS